MTNVFAIRRLKQFGGAEEGQALALGAFVLVVLMLMAGLGVDVGYLRYEKLQMQKAADAAAIAGASALIYGGQVQLAAQERQRREWVYERKQWGLGCGQQPSGERPIRR